MTRLNWALTLLLLLGSPAFLLAQEEEDASEQGEFSDDEFEFDDSEFDDEGFDDDGGSDDEEFDPSEFDDDASSKEQDLEYINDLLEGDDGALESTGFAYDDGNRRDPFSSLLDVSETRDPRTKRPRPEGIPGLMIDELTVTGIWITEDGPVAQVQAANKAMSYLLRPGDQLFDGDVLRITYERYAGAEVVFKQIVDDPQATKPFREVARRLDP